MDLNVPLRVIGFVRCRHTELENTPIQAGVNRAEHGVIDVEPEFADGLGGLAGFDCAWMLTWLHRQGAARYRRCSRCHSCFAASGA